MLNEARKSSKRFHGNRFTKWSKTAADVCLLFLFTLVDSLLNASFGSEQTEKCTNYVTEISKKSRENSRENSGRKCKRINHLMIPI